ncbi:MAG: RDD family protein [Bacteroidetes bacterium HGW-Bacteroidetes-21]|nr:MAG: RDD family protein [Bacteroidetes bacterium HGW-Bacteroidetes-21]
MASQGKRFANYILDFIFLLAFSFIFGIILGVILLNISPSSLQSIDEDNKLLNYSLNILAGIIYYSTLEVLTGRTIAKYITGTKVVTLTGEKPDYRTILIRTICRYIPFNAFSFLGSDGSGWHDKISKTRVINV